MTQVANERVTPFVDKKMTWAERQDLIHKQFPSVKDFDWEKALNRDDQLFAAIMRDVLKVDQAVPGRPGPRPALDRGRAEASLQRFMGKDFCTLPFTEAFRLLIGTRSLAQAARRCDMSRTQVHRLLHGQIQPDLRTMVVIAEGFDKHPSFFLEYRSSYVLAHLQEKLLDAPESTIDYYRKISNG